MSSESDDSFLRPPLWEDITSSIQNIDPENAIMLNHIPGITQVKLETVEAEGLLEPLSSPLLSPLEIKTEKHLSASYHNNNNSNNINNNIHIHNYQIQNNNYQGSNNFQVINPQLSGYNNGGTNGSGSFVPIHHSQMQNNNYYGGSWYQPQNTQQQNYPPKFSPQGVCPPPMPRLMYAPPLTPPNSDPGSPNNGMQVIEI